MAEQIEAPKCLEKVATYTKEHSADWVGVSVSSWVVQFLGVGVKHELFYHYLRPMIWHYSLQNVFLVVSRCFWTFRL